VDELMTAPKIMVRVTADVIDVQAETALLAIGGNDGAMASFTGFCRDESGTLIALELEHYPGMAERQLTAIAQEAATRFGISALVITHRFGRVIPGDVIVFTAATSRHRDAAFDAARFVMDYLKTDAPFWKKEHRKDGSTGWVSAKSGDDAARERWS
jgi:molybdopterin synthase catalytic subunit